MLKQIEGSKAVAEAVALCRPEVICAYPISPQTHIVEGLGDFVKGFPPERLHTVPATEIAMKRVGRPLPNAALLGAFAAATGLISLEAVGKAIRAKFPARIAEANILAAADAFKHVRHEAGATEHAQAD